MGSPHFKICAELTVLILKLEGESTRIPSALLGARVPQQCCWLAGAGRARPGHRGAVAARGVPTGVHKWRLGKPRL